MTLHLPAEPSTDSENSQSKSQLKKTIDRVDVHKQLVRIATAKCMTWFLVGGGFFFIPQSVYAPCYVRSDKIGSRKHGVENGAGLQVTN